MNYRLVKHHNTLGWDWYLELDDCSSWVSQLVKYVIESLEAENASLQGAVDGLCNDNAKLRELVRSVVRCIADVPDCDSCVLGEQVSGVWVCHLIGAAKELGVEVDK